MNMKERITPGHITILTPNEIFVFDSNLEGAHSGEAALFALNKWKNVWGQGVG